MMANEITDPFHKWHQVNGHLYTRRDPVYDHVQWEVAHRADGWYWYVILQNHPTDPVKASSEFGPHTSWMSAAADCEVAHRDD